MWAQLLREHSSCSRLGCPLIFVIFQGLPAVLLDQRRRRALNRALLGELVVGHFLAAPLFYATFYRVFLF